MNVRNKVVLVTGSSKGIGAATAREFARAGATVILAARSLGPLEKQADAIRKVAGEVMIISLDVTSDESVTAAVARIYERFGRLDILVNNAGTGGRLGFWLDQQPTKMREMLEVHLFGMERMTRAVLPRMLERGEGTIVNIVSAIAWAPMATAAEYCAAKAAVLAFSQALQGEIKGRGVDVLVFAPGHANTDSAWPLETGQILTPEKVAHDLVRSITLRRKLFVSGLSNRNLVWLQRFFPSFAAQIITKIGLDAEKKMRRAS